MKNTKILSVLLICIMLITTIEDSPWFNITSTESKVIDGENIFEIRILATGNRDIHPRWLKLKIGDEIFLGNMELTIDDQLNFTEGTYVFSLAEEINENQTMELIIDNSFRKQPSIVELVKVN